MLVGFRIVRASVLNCAILFALCNGEYELECFQDSVVGWNLLCSIVW